jgi:hypothetical protein
MTTDSRPGDSVPALRTDARIEDPDGFYERWLDAHRGLTEQQSFELNARLVLLLANQVASDEVLKACIAAAAKPYPRGANNG